MIPYNQGCQNDTIIKLLPAIGQVLVGFIVWLHAWYSPIRSVCSLLREAFRQWLAAPTEALLSFRGLSNFNKVERGDKPRYEA